jgi:hypothetical protein
MEDESPNRRYYFVNHEEDVPQSAKGLLIPYKKKRSVSLNKIDKYAAAMLLPLAALVFMFSAGFIGMQSIASVGNATLPLVEVKDVQSNDTKPLNYGVQVALSQPNFFAETRDAFIESATTFIEADLTSMQLRYFEDGVLVKSMEIKAKGKDGSWWQTPAGLYKIEFKKENHFSSIGQVYQPWSMAFQGNFFIHGWPNYPGGKPVEANFSGGCIRLENEDAEALFKMVSVNTPILVHELAPEEKPFVYEPKVPELKTPHYLIADVESSTVLASSNLDAVAPIASITKLMSALVAAEYINLDSSVFVNEPNFVQSLIPRLGDRTKVSMYSLLQLLLVESSNEAAEVIAAQLGREVFIENMNEKAISLGMLNTTFADPSGLSSDNVSTIGDLFRLAQYISTNRSFIFELTANQDLPTAYTGGQFGELVNFNKVEDLDNFIGGKVGETLAAGQTSLTLHRLTVKGQERTLAIIILGSKNRNEDVRELLKYAEERFGN